MLRDLHPKDISDLDWVHRNVENDCSEQILSALKRTLQATITWSTDKDTMIFGASTIKRILTIIHQYKTLKLPIVSFEELISYIKRVWNHQADIVCHDAVDSFTLIVKIHQKQCDLCQEMPPEENAANCDWINETVQWLLEPTSLYRSRFRCLLSLVRTCPSLCVNLTPDFFNRAYVHLNNPTLSSVICELIIFHLLEYNDLWYFHATSIKNFSSKNDRSVIKNRFLRMIEKKEELIPFLQMLFGEVKKVNGLEDLILEVCRSLINNQGKKQIVNNFTKDYREWSHFLEYPWILDQIIHSNPNVSISAFRLIVEHPKKTRPFTEQDLELIKIFVDANMNHQSSGGRQQILKILRTALLRIGESLESVLKDVKKAKVEIENVNQSSAGIRRVLNTNLVDEDIKNAEDFVRFLSKLSFDSLKRNANFNRRMMSLCLIDLLYNKSNYISNGKERFVEYLHLDSTLGSNRLKSIQNCLDDSYDLCQKVALGILKTVDFGENSIDEEAYLKNIDKLMESVKTRNTSAAGYRIQYYIHKYPERIQPLLLRYCERLEFSTWKSEENLLNITSNSVHPILNIIEAILETSSTKDQEFYKSFLTSKLLPMCHRIVDVVTPVVHNLSPEGYYPETSENSENLQNSQHLLVCCWRAHKHISAIFAWVFTTLLCSQLDEDEVHKIGEFYWTQLTECKHRGAFECAVEGFNKICQFLWISENPKHPKPDLWLNQILDSLKGEGVFEVSKNLCTTRRSAGLPFLIVSIVQTEPSSRKSEALRKTAERLLDMTGKNEEMRVHSMNCMKALVMASSLNEKITFALEKTLHVTVSACRAPWNERNAGSLLFSAIKTRVFGVSRSMQKTLQVDQKNRQSNVEFFTKFPRLYIVLKEQLEEHLEKEYSPEYSLLPLLVILTHLVPTSTVYYPLKPFLPILLRIALRELSNSHREHACQAILAIMEDSNEIFEWISNILSKTENMKNIKQNHLHCVLLLLGGILEKSPEKSFILERLTGYYFCDFNLKIYLELANKFTTKYDLDEYEPSDNKLDSFCLAKRPIAQKLLFERDALKTEMSIWVKDREIRREIYRLIYKNGWDVCLVYLRAFIVSVAINDLKDECIEECDVRKILLILSSAEDFVNKDMKKLLEIILMKTKHRWTLDSTKSAVNQVETIVCEKPLDTFWIRKYFSSEDDLARKIALNAGCRCVANLKPNMTLSDKFYKVHELKLISAVAIYLQDDDSEIREKASVNLSHLLSFSTPLNPAVCALLISKWILNADDNSSDDEDDGSPEEIEEDNYDDCSDDSLFDACSFNQYAENEVFGNIQLYYSIRERTGEASDVFELEMD